MIEIIKKGKEKFNMICPRCGCEYTYQAEDIEPGDIVPCPECKYRCVHTRQDYPYTISTPPITMVPYDTTPIPCNTYDIRVDCNNTSNTGSK